MEDGLSELLLDFCCHPEFFAVWFHHSTPAECEIGCSIALWTGAKPGDAGGREFQSASPCEQRAASRLRPLMPPGRAVTSCARWHKKSTTFPRMPSVCLHPTPAGSWRGMGGRLSIEQRAVTLTNTANELIGRVKFWERSSMWRQKKTHRKRQMTFYVVMFKIQFNFICLYALNMFNSQWLELATNATLCSKLGMLT